MKKIVTAAIALCLSVMVSHAQYTITGKVQDKSTKQPIELATIQLLKPDSTYVNGVSTTATGSFSLEVKKAGSYIVKSSFIGYKTAYVNVTLSNKAPKAVIDTIVMEGNDVLLKETVVKEKVAKVEMKADTFVYNAAAYRVPVGSRLESLVEQLPGAEVSDDGTVKINGKTVKQILMNGKDFFKGDTKIAMKNLPTELVSTIKAYDKKSDYTKQTGIDDGNEETVLDIGLKKELKESWVGNADMAVGNHKRYAGNLFVNRYTDNDHETAFANANNVGDRGFRRWGGGSSGLNASKSAGVDLGWDNGIKEGQGGHFEVGGSMRWNHSADDNQTRSNSETFLNSGSSSSFSNSKSADYSHNTTFNTRLTLRWNPDSMSTVMFFPNFNHSENSSWSQSRSATFNSDPYAISGVTDPLESIFNDTISALNDITVNTNRRLSKSHSTTNSADYWGMYVRRLNSLGRNFSVSSWGSWSKTNSKSYSRSDINYFQTTAANSNTFTNQYNNNPSKNWNLGARISYSEPITKHFFAEFSYSYSYSYSNTDRSLYELDSLASWRDMYTPPIGTIPSGDSLKMTLNTRNSQYATYKDYNHNASVGLRYNTQKIQFHVGVNFEPQRTKLSYQKDKLDTVVTRNVFNVSPNVRLRYKISNTSQLDMRYRGRSTQPSMTDLLDVTDDSNPLYISKGNPGLKPSWNNEFGLFYNNYIPDSQMGWMANINFSQTSNSISNTMEYNETTGVRTTMPKNINGNWSTQNDFMFNTAFGKDKSWNVSVHANFSYSNNVGYVSTQSDTVSRKNTTKTTNVGDDVRLSYRTGLFEFGVNGGFTYQHARNKLQSNADLDTWNYHYGGNINVSFPWNMQITSDIRMNSRRGYSDNSMNTNELIWNAQLAQSFLKNNAATVSIQFYDILHKQSNVSRTINAQMRSDSWNNSINSYFMVHFIYRLSIFGGNNNGDNNNNRGGFRRQGGGGRFGGGGPGGRGGRR